MKSMPHARRVVLAVLLACTLLRAGATVAQESAPPGDAPPAPTRAESAMPVPATVNVVLHTALGDITLALEKERAPITVANFLRYVDQRRFDGIGFYRAVKLDEEGKYGLVQGGLKGDTKRVFKPIAHEAPSQTGLSHVSGAVSMARGAPGSARADFFIVVGDLKSLDGQAGGEDPGYAVFGHVAEGMEIVRQILDLPRSTEAPDEQMKGQMLASPVRILTVRRAD
jgi:peptidyl-prolyl cis-trans isomerase A (cyclophilin A)